MSAASAQFTVIELPFGYGLDGCCNPVPSTYYTVSAPPSDVEAALTELLGPKIEFRRSFQVSSRADVDELLKKVAAKLNCEYRILGNPQPESVQVVFSYKD